ncbi:hypothetical protein PRIPAC_91453 [Pristionchus pacificus]|uniref:Cytochrome P450 n=1 Tax=Pristionchus pacificus TaxID=54126 RepID=A0A2A6CGZ1_PRIPA|nr:hypothetical protein PRIPAC_91453 [Pristionchus pacificus]|eukprot:PDM77333.1 cytochrome P450 [Pristionchus pacificus]
MIWLLFIAVSTWICYEILQRRCHLKLREEIGLTGPPTSFFFGNFLYMFDTIKKKVVEFTPYIYPELERIYGATFGFYYGTNLEIVTTDPAIIKEVFISQFGNFIARKKIAINMVYPILDGLVQVDHIGSYGAGWKEIRSTISEIFTSSKMKKMHLMFHDQLDNMMNVLSEKSKVNDGTVDIYAEMQAISMDLIGKCALGQEILCVKYSFPSSNIFVDSQSSVKRSTFSFKNSLQTFKTIRPLPDLIDLMLAENDKRKENGGIPLHHDVIVSNAWAFFIGGYETTASSLTFTAFLLAKYPEVQQTLYEELSSTFSNNEPIDYERVMKLPYLHAVFSESLRVCPPIVTFTGRRCIKYKS